MSDKKLLNAALRNDLALFIERVFRTVSPGSEYLHNWHIEAIAHRLMLCARGDIK